MIKQKITKTFLSLLSFLIISCFFMNGTGLAQTASATLQGVVTDDEGIALPGVDIVMRNMETGYVSNTVTRNNGSYIISGIQPGIYQVEVELEGFATETRKELQFAVGANLKIDFTLKPASLQEDVTVTAETPMVEMTKSDISSVVDRQKIDDLPLLDRNFDDLSMLKAGVLEGRTNALQRGGGEMLVDGVSNEDVIQNTAGSNLPADAIKEFRVMTNNAAAEFGNAAGMIRTAVTRSGTNEFQGRLSYFYRDESFGSANYFLTHTGYQGEEIPKDEWDKAPYSRHNFGGFLGGPIVKDKAHFFLLYEGTQLKEYSTITSPLVPNETIEQPYSVNKLFGKLNYQLNQRNLLSVRFSTSPSNSENQGVGGLYSKERAYSVEGRGFQIVGNWTSFPSDNTLNEFRVLILNSNGSYMPDYPDLYSIERPSGYFGKDNDFPQESYANKYQVVENFSMFLGDHNIKAGLEYIYAPNGTTRMDLYRPGLYVFYTDQPFNASDPSTYPIMLQYTDTEDTIAFDIPYTFFTPFIQDSWKVNSRLTLNFGLRYNYYKLESVDMQNGSIKHFNPRFGFSWDPIGDGKTSIRGGAGTYSANLQTNPVAPVVFWDQFDLRIKLFPGYPDPSVPNPFMPEFTAFPAITSEYVEGSAVAPWTFQTSLGVQREVITDLALSADIVYTRGYDAIRKKQLNPVIPGTLTERPDPTRGQVTTIETAGKSEYKGLYLTADKRYSNGWSLYVSYTLSKAMGDTDDPYGMEEPWTNEDDCWERAWGRMSNDARHKITASATVDLPLGFQASGIFFYRSAYPWNAIYAEDVNLDNINEDYVDEYRNSRTGFDQIYLNMRISKYVDISKLRLQFFAEVYNVSNRVNFRNVNNVYGTPTFGEPTSAGDPRLLQLGIRLDWY